MTDTKCTAPKCDCDWPVCRKERSIVAVNERDELTAEKQMSRPRKKPHEQTMWVIKDTSDDPKFTFFWSGIMEYKRSECIDAFTDGAHLSWSEYRKEGYRCVKVKVTEIVK